jgi:CHAT domain-containing protein
MAMPPNKILNGDITSNDGSHHFNYLSRVEPETAYYRVLSSYTASLKALKYARDRKAANFDSWERRPLLLTVSMATTSGADALPGVDAEVSVVEITIGNMVEIKKLDQPDARTVLDYLSTCSIVHFACHGISHPSDPFQSGLDWGATRGVTV